MNKLLLVTLVVIGLAVVVQSQVRRGAGGRTGASQRVGAGSRKQQRIAARDERRAAKKARLAARQGKHGYVFVNTCVAYYNERMVHCFGSQDSSGGVDTK